MSLPLLFRAIRHTFIISWPTLIEALKKQVDPVICDRRLADWSRQLIRDARIDLSVSGLEHVQPDASYVVMSNHASLYDIPVLYCALPLRLRMAAKTELFRIPIWGSALRASGFIRIDRKRGAEARQALLEAGSAMQAAGMSLWVAPEGTRSVDGRLLPFKTGAFSLAMTAKIPILPVTLLGTSEVLGKQGRRVVLGRAVQVIVHPPLFPESFPVNPNDLVNQVRQVIQNVMPPSTST